MAYLLGGLSLFLYGQFLLERSIQKFSRIHIHAFIKLLARHRLIAVLIGALLTIGMQSSTIAILNLLGLINLGVLHLGTAVGIVLGASIGTTITVQAISFNIAGYAMWFIAVGFVLSKLLRYARGELLIGLGFMFYGIYLMGQGADVFKQIYFGNPFLNLLGAFVLTVISQSTLAPMAVGISLMREGASGLNGVIPIILGAHLGAGILPLVYSWQITGTNAGRQLGIANLIYRIISVMVILPFIGLLADVSLSVSHSPARQLANAHTLFTLFTAGFFIPFAAQYADFIRWLLPERETVKNVSRGNPLDEKKELMQKVYKLLNDSMRLWEEENLKEIDRIEKECFSAPALRMPTPDADTGILEDITDLEKIAGIIGTKLVDMARRRIMQGLDFSIEGLNEVLNIHRRIAEEFKLKTYDKEIDPLISSSFKAHIDRMRKGFRETKETSALHTDALALLEEMHWRVGKITPHLLR